MRRLLLVVGIVLLGGCAVRTYTLEKPRTDTDMEGNRGYLAGQPQEEEKQTRLGRTRKVSVVEVEFGSYHPKVVEEGAVRKRAREGIPFDEEIGTVEEFEVEPMGVESEKFAYKTYTIQKNDSLQKISHKFYGTTRKWKFLYEQNKDVLKSPDKIYPGVTIKIPILD
ncbi:MAG: LysM peptidoglycan-binding domain-containing protein [Candidatus Omnitrophota bacterium]|nr:MAG: LysM peptidoglycan-binding domain-containing protein [Candidatus Omnitrophota bacterium]